LLPARCRTTRGSGTAFGTRGDSPFGLQANQHHRWAHTRHAGYLLSQQKRKRIEEIFGWLKTVAGLRKTRHRGVARVGWMFTFALAAYNLVRMRNLEAAAG